jgi:hypothetical protein
MVDVDSKIARLPLILRVGAWHPLAMAALLLVGSSALAQGTGALSNNRSRAHPMYCECVSGKCRRACGGKNLSLALAADGPSRPTGGAGEVAIREGRATADGGKGITTVRMTGITRALSQRSESATSCSEGRKDYQSIRVGSIQAHVSTGGLNRLHCSNKPQSTNCSDKRRSTTNDLSSPVSANRHADRAPQSPVPTGSQNCLPHLACNDRYHCDKRANRNGWLH